MSALPARADQLVEELSRTPEKKNGIDKVRYSHLAMVDLIVQNPWISQNDLAAYFGYSPAWISCVIASDAFQAALAARREEIIDPAIKATIEERFRALVVRSLEVLQAKLNQPVVNDNVALRAAELGAKALGIGGHAAPPPSPPADRLQILAGRLLLLQSTVREGKTYEAQPGEVLSLPEERVPV